MKFYDTYPLTTLTKADVEGMSIYGTEGSLRRATSVKPTVTIPASDNLPELSYREERNPITGKVQYTIHTTTKSICRFLLLKSVVESEIE